MSVEAAAGRILTRAAVRRFDPQGIMILAAAAALVGPAMPPQTDPGLALICAAARGAARQEIDTLTKAVRPAMRAAVLTAAEPLLARIDPAWAWHLIVDRVGCEAGTRSALLGLAIAARLDPAAAATLLAQKLQHNRLFARQLRADATARRRTDITAVPGEPPASDLFPSESAAYLAGAALSDPQRALGFADAILQVHPPLAVQQALDLLAAAVTSAGHGERIIALARKDGFIAEQAAWTRAAALAGALPDAALLALATTLRPRVADELDPDDVSLAGLPLLVALAKGGTADLLSACMAEWRIAPAWLIEVLFGAGVMVDATVIARSREVPPLQAGAAAGYGGGWWPAAAPQQTEACADALLIAAAVPWRPVPGTLADIVNWPAGG
jgi:hypothetical protein